MRITFDPAKRAATLARRGLDFAEAGLLRSRLVVLVWTPRGAARRVISMRYAHEKEERLWRARFGPEG